MVLRIPRSAPSRLLSRLATGLLLLAMATVLSGCATTPQAEDKPKAKNQDPFEEFNRDVYKFNEVLDQYALKPVATAYHDYTPKLVQDGIGNFFENLGYPTTILNQLLQGKFKEGGQDTARFLLNTTLGWAGLIDVASGGTKLPKHEEDSGQTLGVWGVPAGPYLMLPFLGPATVRDAPARVADDFTQPFRWYDAGAERWASVGLNLVDKRAEYLPLDKTLEQTYDPYAFIRNAYLQRRQYAVYDGNPPEGQLSGDDEDWEAEALRESEEPAAGEVDAVEPATDEEDSTPKQ